MYFRLIFAMLPFQLWDQLKKRKAIAFFVQDLPETASKKLFVDCQLHIWAVEGNKHNFPVYVIIRILVVSSGGWSPDFKVWK